MRDKKLEEWFTRYKFILSDRKSRSRLAVQAWLEAQFVASRLQYMVFTS